MKKTGIFIIVCFLMAGCQKIDKELLISTLPGYWEIDKVELKDGTTKEYNVSTTIDFIKLTTKNEGFRKKLQPNLVGKFFGSDDVERFEIIEGEGGIWLQYSTNLMRWKEKIIDINPEQLIVKNKEGLIYHYKRYKPMEILE